MYCSCAASLCRVPLPRPFAASLCRVLLIASSLFALCVPVLAGSYVARYSGTSNATSNTCTISGAGECKVVATMVWTPDSSNPVEPPPKSAIISVSGNAHAGGYGPPNSGFGASCDDGGGTACVINTSPSGGGGSIIGVGRYRVQSDPGASFEITEQPKAKVTGSSIAASLSVTLNVTATPVQIALSGTTLDNGSLKGLTGQGLTATMTGFTRPLVSKPLWSFKSGGSSCFGQFYVQEAKTYTQASDVPDALSELGVTAPASFPVTYAANSFGGEIGVKKDDLMLSVSSC